MALVPEVVERLAENGLAVTIEDGAGEGAHLSNAAYEQAGASIGDGFSGEVVAKVAPRPPRRSRASTRAPCWSASSSR